MPRLCNKLVIVGVGLIGGSLARAVKRNRVAGSVIGVGRSAETINKALRLGVIDKGSLSLGEALPGADMVVLAAPVKTIERQLGEVATLTSEDCTVTDVGSVKANLVASVSDGFPGLLKRYIPAHPIAGTEQSGVEASFAELFENKHAIVTPTAQSSFRHIERVTQLWEAAGATVLSMEPAEHDRIFAWTSHLPHAVAFALVNAMVRHPDAETLFDLAAAGFYDFTRISSSDPTMWRDISLANREALLQALAGFRQSLQDLEQQISKADGKSIEQFFETARNARDKGLAQKQNNSGS